MSSLQQKMVVVTSAQPSELEQKKKRQTLERAKATHLSKQLQMRLQYARLKVEHGWQRQTLNEVENLYFHHSHQRNMRQGAAQRPHYAMNVTYPTGVLVPADTHVALSPTPPRMPDRTAGSSPTANDASLPGSVSPPSRSLSEHAPIADGQPSSQSQPCPLLPVSPALNMTDRPPSALDLSDPNILARLVQLQAQVQLPPSQSWAQSLQGQTQSCHSSTIPSTPSTSASLATPVPAPVPGPSAFSPHIPLSQPPGGHPQPALALLSTSMAGPTPLYPVPPFQPPISAASSMSGLVSPPTASIPTPSIPTSTHVNPSALTYDSFWSTHTSSAGSTRALYRTQTGFTTSAAPGGNVAMLTPGGHAVVMTTEGVFVGGVSK